MLPAELRRREGKTVQAGRRGCQPSLSGAWDLISKTQAKKTVGARTCPRPYSLTLRSAPCRTLSVGERLRAAGRGLLGRPDGRGRFGVGRARVGRARVHERERQHLVDGLDELDGHGGAHLLGQLLQILLVVLRDE